MGGRTGFYGNGGQTNDPNSANIHEGIRKSVAFFMIHEKWRGMDWQSGGREFDPRQLHQVTPCKHST
jgi:hypothetical protein